MANRQQSPATSQKSSKREIRERQRAAREQRRRLTLGVIVVAVLALGAFIVWPRPQAESVEASRLADDPALGPATAPVTLVEYGDFGCPACRAWHNAHILDQVVATYGDQVRFVWRDFPVITPQSPKAAEAAQCAHDQGKFWEYHDLLFARAPAIGLNDLKAYASGIGLDIKTFDQCLDSGQHSATVDRDLQDAIAHGFRGTPSFLLNDQPLAGPPSFEYLQGLIDSILSTAG